MTSPPPITGLPGRAIPGPSIANGTSFSRGPGGARPRDRLGADEAGLLLAAPPEPRLDRVAILAQVVAVQVKADLEPQRVARARARRGSRRRRAARPTPPARRPDRAAARRRPRPCSRCRTRASPRRATDRSQQCIRVRQRPVGEAAARARARRGPWTASIANRVGDVDHVDVELRGVRLHPLEVLLVVGGVGDGQELALGQPVGEQVVEDAAVLAAQHAVLRAALGEPADVVGEHPLQELERPAGRASRSRPCARRRTRRRPLRTARCSCRIPAYWTGISHPANGTSFAPAATWRS